MEAASVNADWTFPKKTPFGFLMTVQVIGSLICFITPHVAPFAYEGMSFLMSTALTLFIMSLMMLVFHIFGWNRQTISVTNGVNLFLPCTLIVFGVSVLFFFLFTFNTMMTAIAFFDSLRFNIPMIISYSVLMCACIATTLACFRLGVLLFRAAPNSQLLQLITVIIDGDKTSRMPGAAPQFSPTTASPV